ncbi:MAG: hypothetical protein JXI43_10910 [Tissierellales bacterium]|nr:hypothetical protein [Tissierellales bacterium]
MNFKREIKYLAIIGGLIAWICILDQFWTIVENVLKCNVNTGFKKVIIIILLLSVILLFLLRIFNIIYNRIFEKGKAHGFKEGIEAAYHGKQILYENIIKRCQHFIEVLSEHRLNELGDCLIQKLSEEPESWREFVERATIDYIDNLSNDAQKNWQELAKATACKYIDATNAVRKGHKGTTPILLSNFNIYAACVTSILETLTNNDFGTHIRVWTLLNKPLNYWYNMIALTNDFTKKSFHCTQDWWENYKKRVSDLKYSEKIQMRRIIVDQKTDDGKKLEDLYLYKENGQVKTLSIEKALSKKQYFEGIRLIKDVEKALDLENEDFLREKLYIIGYPNNGRNKNTKSKSNIHNHWVKLFTHFNEEYHTGFKKFLKDEKGVYYCFVREREIKGDRDLSAYLLFDDIFLVEFSEHDSNIDGFGIALNIDEIHDIVGITLLSGHELNMTRNALKNKWQSGVGSLAKLCT